MRTVNKAGGKLLLIGSRQADGTAWTDSDAVDEERSLKHRHHKATRPVPLHPDLVAILRRHIDKLGVGEDGPLFVMRTGRFGRPLPSPHRNLVTPNTIYRTWQTIRSTAFTEQEARSLAAPRPYDLRHACLSSWLSGGAPPARVAAWAGHSVKVLLRVYAQCIDGDEVIAMQCIEAILPPDASSGA